MKAKQTFTLTLLCLMGFCFSGNAQNSDTNKHSPHKATFYSAILPGLGQAYNKQYIKIPIIYAGFGALGYAIHFNTKYYKKYKSAYRDWIIQDPNNKSYLEFIPPTMTEKQLREERYNWFENALENKKQYYRRYRDLSYIGITALYALQIIDAAVNAHFFNFDISDDLSLRLTPKLTETSKRHAPAIGLQLNFRM